MFNKLRPNVVSPATASLVLLLAVWSQTVNAMYWGVASSGFQHEGYFPDSNWMRYVHAQTNIEDEYKNSVDHYHRYVSDIALAKAMGVNTFRFSIEWARIEPAEGVLNQTELLHYDGVVNAVIAAGMTPMITLDHWVYPGWILDQGAWDKRSTVDKWMKHAQRVVSRYAGRGALWITINEPTVYLTREQTYRQLNIFQQAFMVSHLIQAHRRAYDLIHQLDPGALVSSNFAYQPPPLQLIVDTQFFDQVQDKIDFIAMDYYYGLSLDNWSVAKALNGDIWNIKSQPDGLYYAMMSYHSKVPHLPFYIVENGMPTDNGHRDDGYTRSNHLLDHLYWLQRAVADGVTVIGYNYWSLTDNYEWGTYQPRFGLYKVDVLQDPSLTRVPTDAVATYKEVIARGGVPEGYTPVIPTGLCNVGASFSVCLGQLRSLLTPPTKAPTIRAPTTATKTPTKAPTQWWQRIFPNSQTEETVAEPAPTGAIVGGVLGVVAIVALLGVGAIIVVRRRRTSSKTELISRSSTVLSPHVSSENPAFEATGPA